jgi:hypothetical protein
MRDVSFESDFACARPSWCDPAGESPAQVRPKRAASARIDPRPCSFTLTASAMATGYPDPASASLLIVSYKAVPE